MKKKLAARLTAARVRVRVRERACRLLGQIV